MDGTTLYDADILAWSEQQAAALRRLVGRHDLPNELDLETVAEEIEDVGKSELRAVESLVANVLVHLILLWADPEAPSIRGWRGKIAAWRVALRRRISPSMRAKINMAELWGDAVEVACARLSDWDSMRGDQAKVRLGRTGCPFDLVDFMGDAFDVPVMLAKLPAWAEKNAGGSAAGAA